MNELNSREVAQFFIQTGAHLDMAQEIAKFFIESGAHLDMAKEINKQLTQQVEKQERVIEALHSFAKDLIFVEDVDCGDIEDSAQRHGLIEIKEINEPCDTGEFSACICAEVYDEPPYKCYRATELFKQAKALSKQEKGDE